MFPIHLNLALTGSNITFSKKYIVDSKFLADYHQLHVKNLHWGIKSVLEETPVTIKVWKLILKLKAKAIAYIRSYLRC